MKPTLKQGSFLLRHGYCFTLRKVILTELDDNLDFECIAIQVWKLDTTSALSGLRAAFHVQRLQCNYHLREHFSALWGRLTP